MRARTLPPLDGWEFVWECDKRADCTCFTVYGADDSMGLWAYRSDYIFGTWARQSQVKRFLRSMRSSLIWELTARRDAALADQQ